MSFPEMCNRYDVTAQDDLPNVGVNDTCLHASVGTSETVSKCDIVSAKKPHADRSDGLHEKGTQIVSAFHTFTDNESHFL